MVAKKSVFSELVSVSSAVLLPVSVSTVLYEPVMLLSVVMTVLESPSVSDRRAGLGDGFAHLVRLPCGGRKTVLFSTLVVVVEPVAVSEELSRPVISLPESFVVVCSPEVSLVVTTSVWFVSVEFAVLLPESVSIVLYEPVMLLSVLMTVLESPSVSEDETVSLWFVSVLAVVVEPATVSVEPSAPVISLPVSLVVDWSPDVSWVVTEKSAFCELVSVSSAVLLPESVSIVL